MSIKTKFFILAIVSLIITGISGTVFIQIVDDTKKEIQWQEIINQMRNRIFEKAVLVNEYLLYHEERQKIQLQTVREATNKLLLKAISASFLPDEKTELINFTKNKYTIDLALLRIIENFENKNRGTSDAVMLAEQRLANLIIIKTQENIGIISHLAEASRRRVLEGQQKIVFLFLIFIFGIFFGFIVFLSLIWFFAIKPLLSLKKDILRVSALDFSSSSSSSSSRFAYKKDEIGQLGLAFQEMAGKLKESYANLEQKVRERTKEVEEKNKKLAKSEIRMKQALDLSERANTLMVGRELKIVKLKNEIEKLKEELKMKKVL